MNSTFLLISAFLFAQSAWQEHNSAEGRFKVLLPGIFTEKTDTVQTEVGQLVYHTLFLQTNDEAADNLFYMVSYCDYPQSVAFADSTDLAAEFFETTIAAAAESVKGEVAYSSDIKLDKHPGKQWRIDYLEGKAVIKNRAYLVGSRYYALQTIAWKAKSLNVEGIRFFDSFRLLE